jgi:adenosyl cobinamide kinase/adenosyl cobinamide phosphate guanylyltransferase
MPWLQDIGFGIHLMADLQLWANILVLQQRADFLQHLVLVDVVHQWVKNYLFQ